MRSDEADGFRRSVAILLSRFPSVTETFILREVAEMERQGQPVRLVPLLRDDPPVVHSEALGWVSRALFTPFLSIPILKANLRSLLTRPGLYLALLLRLLVESFMHPRFLLGTLAYFPKSVYLASRLTAEGVRHVHAHFASHPSTAALVISRFSDISFSVTVHAHDLFVARHTPFLGMKLRSASFVRVISEFNRRYIRDHYPQVDPGRVHVVRVGVPIDHYFTADADARPRRPIVESREPHKKREEAQILSVAGLRPYKALDVLVEACRSLRAEGVSFSCKIIGEGPMRASLERQITEAGLENHVTLLGAMSQAHVADYLKTRPIFVMPSVILSDGMMDGIPVALMEAMASGCPVVASGISGIPELVEDGVGGILLEPGNSAELAAALQSLATDPRLARSLGSRATEKVKTDFSLDKSVEALLSLIDEENPPIDDLFPQWGPNSRKALDALPPISTKAQSRSAGARLLHVGPDSRVVELLVSGPDRPFRWVVKAHESRPGQSRPPALRARHEYEIMETISSSWKDGAGPSPVPFPVGLQEEMGIVVMEASTGRRLDQIIQSARWGKTTASVEAEEAFEATGRWLREFQNVFPLEETRSHVLEKWIEQMGENLTVSEPLLCRHTLAKAEGILNRVRAATGHLGIEITGQHGDFWPGNVLVTSTGIQVVDFEGFRAGVSLEDPAYFLLHSQIPFDLPFCRRRFSSLRNAFWRGYGEGLELDSTEYHLSRISVCLRLLALDAKNLSRPSVVLRQRRLRKLRRVLNGAMACIPA